MAKEQKKDPKKVPVWNKYTEAEKKALHKLNEGYKSFLSQCKTERESVVEAVKQAEKEKSQVLHDYLKGIRFMQFAWARPLPCLISELNLWRMVWPF